MLNRRSLLSGAYGDHLIWSSTIPFLQRFHSPINLEMNLKGIELFNGDPRFDYISCFDVNNLDEAERYDVCLNRWAKLQGDCEKSGARYLNFWSSLENTCILHEHNIDASLPQNERKARYGGNFYEKTFEIADLQIPHGWVHENTLHFTPSEIAVVERWKERNKDHFIMMVAIGGSSRQKVFPTWLKDYCCRLIDTYPRLKIYLMGGQELARDVWEYERTVSYVNGASPVNLSYRQAILMTKYADYVLGGETGLMIGAGMMGTPKTILFTLAAKDQLVRHHRNDYSVQSTSECSPCFTMRYSGIGCPNEPVYGAFPLCTHEFDKEELTSIFDRLYCGRY